jgi:OFA family oxalate/formate antiporter-like MFS transporter
MLCIGSVYAWSVFVPELKTVYGFSTAQTQLVFGVLTAIFPTTMIFAGRVERRIGSRPLTALAALFFGSGYLLAGFSGGLFAGVLLGIGVLAGIGTGFGYLAALTTPSNGSRKRGPGDRHRSRRIRTGGGLSRRAR